MVATFAWPPRSSEFWLVRGRLTEGRGLEDALA